MALKLRPKISTPEHDHGCVAQGGHAATYAVVGGQNPYEALLTHIKHDNGLKADDAFELFTASITDRYDQAKYIAGMACCAEYAHGWAACHKGHHVACVQYVILCTGAPSMQYQHYDFQSIYIMPGVFAERF